ncbi:LysR substrate-binding domain-containing protein [Oceanimonas sp. MB9]|uniref:LysR substrate-binding domain-containing protein n=1 Tax=Oceanimonas sp. MB9 TaxID=2588453 RepID=UPI0013F60E9C|nr:LysR substrate-binding domain-containing protein [Oceanimonas sp. MB9]NHI01691.1 Glycine cleavage system transcriptional activator [Oceanimonas sp. MB9]
MNNTDNPLLNRLTQAAPLLAVIGKELSFTKAAEILGIQQSAVSHRVRSLEEALGLRLFDRTTRRLSPTPAGRIVCEAAAQAVAIWPQALARLSRLHTGSHVQLSVASSLAMKWLIPLLNRSAEYGVEVAINVQDELSSFDHDTIDAAIRFGTGPYPGLHAVHLCHAQLQPVVSPHLTKHHGSLAWLASRELPLLSDRRGEQDSTDFSWHHYFAQQGMTAPATSEQHRFDRADLMLQAAINGMGIGLGRTLLIEQDLDSGFLRKIGPALALKSSYWLVCKPGFAQTERHAHLRRWLTAQVKQKPAR